MMTPGPDHRRHRVDTAAASMSRKKSLHGGKGASASSSSLPLATLPSAQQQWQPHEAKAFILGVDVIQHHRQVRLGHRPLQAILQQGPLHSHGQVCLGSQLGVLLGQQLAAPSALQAAFWWMQRTLLGAALTQLATGLTQVVMLSLQACLLAPLGLQQHPQATHHLLAELGLAQCLQLQEQHPVAVLQCPHPLHVGGEGAHSAPPSPGCPGPAGRVQARVPSEKC
ncbi:UNVERIFIED_CONTAM: hypothetical protein K2H54_056790 [Gekko kuhli]